MTPLFAHWQVWALLSATFAAMTAILAKIGVSGVGSDFATFLRTLVIVPLLALILTATRGWESPSSIPARSALFLVLSGLATGASWLCYFRALKLGEVARVAPVDKLSVVMVAVFGAAVLGERLGAGSWLGVGLITVGVILLAVGR